MLSHFRNRRRPLVIAHQGGLGLRPTNTLMAFEEAARLGADVLDTDVHVSRDGVVVAIHDDTVDRTTEGRGRVRDMTLAELQSLDAGYRYTEDGKTYPFRGKGARIPTLSALLERFPEHPWIIELKPADRGACQALAEVVRGCSERVLVGSFSLSASRFFRRCAPGVATCASEPEVALFCLLSLLGLSRWVRWGFGALAVPLRSHGITVVTERFARAARSCGVALAPWTVNEPAEMRRLLPWVDGINTDRPDVLLQVLDEQRNNRV